MELKTELMTGNALEVLQELPDNKFRMCMTSPPYWGQRKYGEGTVDIWDGSPDCEHDWEKCRVEHDNLRYRGKDSIVGAEKKEEIRPGKVGSGGVVCSKCGAWQGQLGLEPTYNLYVKHIVDILREVKRVLTPDGSLYLVLGDTFLQRNKLGLPWKIRFALNDDGWISRSDSIYPDGVGLWIEPTPADIVWHKPNAMPDSVKTRLAVTNEFIFHLVLENKGGPFWALLRNRPDPESEVEPKKIEKKQRLAMLWDEAVKWWSTTPSHGVSKLKDFSIVPKKYRPVIWKMPHFFDLDAIRIPHKQASQKRWAGGGEVVQLTKGWDESAGFQGLRGGSNPLHPAGKNPPDVFDGTEVAYRAQLRKGRKYEGKGSPQRVISSFKPEGKNPADTVMFPERQPHRKGGSLKDQIMRETRNRETHGTHSKGKNPRDVYAGRRQFDKGTRLELGIPSASQDERMKLYHPLGANPGDFWSIITDGYEGAHFAVYPPELCERPILSSSMPGDWVLDIFVGSGTTGAVAKKYGRNFLGIDRNPEYIELARKRLQKTPWGRQLNQMTIEVF